MTVTTQFRRLNPRPIAGRAGGIGFLFRPARQCMARRPESRDAGGGNSTTIILDTILLTIREMAPRVIWGVFPIRDGGEFRMSPVCGDCPWWQLPRR